MEFNEDQPIYVQIINWVYDKIIKGEWEDDSRIPSVRELGLKLAVNPHTVLKAYDKLQAENIIYNKRGIGYFTAPEAARKIKDEMRQRFMEEELPVTYSRMKVLGITMGEMMKIMERLKTNENENEQ